MNFIVTENKYMATDQEEVVIIELNRNHTTDHVYLHFPHNRFSNQEEKTKAFIHLINGKVNTHNGAIATKASSYKIYDAFYQIFY